MMDRVVKQVHPTLKAEEAQELRVFSEFAGHPNIVLLGDPGAGKSHLFRYAAHRVGARLVTARAFLNVPSIAVGSTLFVDGLDEKRAGRGDNDTIDAMVRKLFATSPTRIRLSCRAQDWLGQTDLAAFEPYFEQHGGSVVLSLEPLTDDEQRVVLHDKGETNASVFLQEAKARGLEEFLTNPQNLIMLWDVAHAGKWPTTRKQLFEDWSNLLLTEHNPNRSRSGIGAFTALELKDTAGAVCAVRLIADVEGISLKESSVDQSFPSYRTIVFLEPDKARAALSRRAFVTGGLDETVDYAHRTTAEFLAANWLAKQVRLGLPLGRSQALIGLDDHPASELRGLNAWLAVHLPKHANVLIDGDPYGVLTYGDAASLAPSSRQHLLQALGKLSESDPWFRSEGRSSATLGALASDDMVPALRSVLRSNTANYGLRILVADIVAEGHPLPALTDDLLAVLARQSSSYVERLRALDSLLKIGQITHDAIVQIYHDKLGSGAAAVRLRGEIVSGLYGKPFGVGHIAQLLDDILKCPEELPTGTLWSLTQRIPVTDIPTLLDCFTPLEADSRSRTGRRNAYDAFHVLERLLVRLLEEANGDLPPDGLWRWLSTRRRSREWSPAGRGDGIRAQLRHHPTLLRGVVDSVVDGYVVDEWRWGLVHRLQETLLYSFEDDDLLEWLVDGISRAVTGSEKEKFLYELALTRSYSGSERARRIFDQLYALGDTREDLGAMRARAVSCAIEDWQRKDNAAAARARAKRQKTKIKNIEEFEKNSEVIRSGSHLPWLGWLSQIYFNGDESTPRQRLAAKLDEEKANIAVQGFIATLNRDDIPSPKKILQMAADQKWCPWWHAIIAGMDERWHQVPDLSDFNDEFIASVIAINLLYPTYDREGNTIREAAHGWFQRVLSERSSIVRDVYLTIARARFEKSAEYVEGLHELLHAPELTVYRRECVRTLLWEFPNPRAGRLKDILQVGIGQAAPEVLSIARNVLSGGTTIGEDQRDLWLTAAYLLAPDEFASIIQTIASTRVGIVWLLRDMAGYDRYSQAKGPNLRVVQIECVAGLVASHFPKRAPPQSGWSGNRNSWDGAEFASTLISRLSAIPVQTATDALNRMMADNRFATYREDLRHAMANQAARRREVEYHQPDWQETVRALSNGAPANVADLHALLLAQLRDLAIEIGSANTDAFKRFWNEDRYGRTTMPKPEESCRDALVDMLRTRLRPLGIGVEPEGHMAGDRRADILVSMAGAKVLSELKRDYHPDLWSAAEAQLERFYTRDPDAKGYGIYVVFWFSEKRPTPIAAPPGNVSRPRSASEMEEMLLSLIPAEKRSRIVALVIDVSGP
jgi:hypothetical protein